MSSFQGSRPLFESIHHSVSSVISQIRVKLVTQRLLTRENERSPLMVLAACGLNMIGSPSETLSTKNRRLNVRMFRYPPSSPINIMSVSSSWGPLNNFSLRSHFLISSRTYGQSRCLLDYAQDIRLLGDILV
jgi:hypothetical protein